MQVQLSHYSNNTVKLRFNIEKHDRICARRIGAGLNRNGNPGYRSYCPNCLKVFDSVKRVICPYCLPQRIQLVNNLLNYGVWRRYYQRKIRELFNHKPYGCPIHLDVTYFESNKLAGSRDIDNIYNMVVGLVSETIITDDTLVISSTIQKLPAPHTQSWIEVLLIPYQNYLGKNRNNLQPHELVYLYKLSERFGGNTMYIPKAYHVIYQDCSDSVTKKLHAAFSKVVTIGVAYQNVIDAVRSNYPELNLLTDNWIRQYYRAYKRQLKLKPDTR